MDTKYVEVAVSTSMSKSFMIEVPENATREDILAKAKDEIIPLHISMDLVKQVFDQLGIRIIGIDFDDWNVDELEYVTD